MKRLLLVLILGLAVSLPASAILTSGTVPLHNHSNVAGGGSALSPASVAATGAVSGATVTATGAVTGGSIVTTGAVTSTKACATGYTRIGTNYCLRNLGTSALASPSANGCAQSSALSGVSDAKAVLVQVYFALKSTAAIGLKSGTVSFYGPADTSCSSTNRGIVTSSLYLTTTSPASGTTVSESNHYFVVDTDTSGRFYSNPSVSASSGFFLTAIGYYD